MMRVFNVFVAAIILHSGVLTADSLLGLPPLPLPENYAQSAAKIALGRKLFNDRRLSADGTISCATCHQREKAFTDGLKTARGIRQIAGPRNAPTIINAAFYTSFFVDGRRNSLKTQALDPFVNAIEHGFDNHQSVIEIILSDKDYPRMFKDVSDSASNNIKIDHVTEAIASFEGTLLAGDSPFDRYFFGGDKRALSASAVRGLNIFRRKGNCANCHEISWDHALLTDNRYYNLGVGFSRIQPRLQEFLESLNTKPKLSSKSLNVFYDDHEQSELGRYRVTGDIEDLGKFKTPTLRNVALTAPYMHDGSQATLEAVVDYYDRGGQKNRFLDPAIFPLMLSDVEKADLVTFLKALTSPEYAPTH